ncbi:hypothetical protein MMC19_006038 [Ptychographa xylographoides]|nr:hypothetical protein [Ptychographa xylographoides]
MSGDGKKRKVLTDFFLPSSKFVKAPCVNPSRTSPTPLAVPGLSLISDFVNMEEEASILAFLNHKQRTWRTDLSRRTMHFGGEYCLMPPRTRRTTVDVDGTANHALSSIQPEIVQAPPMPEEFNWLLQRMKDRGIYSKKQTPQYCIVNHYIGNLGISAHTENFSFSQPVVGLSLLNSCSMRFHELVTPDGGSVRSGKASKAKRTGRYVDVMLPGRSVVIMNDDARWKWQHEIVRSSTGRGIGWERISLTFRVKP